MLAISAEMKDLTLCYALGKNKICHNLDIIERKFKLLVSLQLTVFILIPSNATEFNKIYEKFQDFCKCNLVHVLTNNERGTEPTILSSRTNQVVLELTIMRKKEKISHRCTSNFPRHITFSDYESCYMYAQ